MFKKKFSSLDLRYFSFLILTISICYSVFGNYPNNWGDPYNYLEIANDLHGSSLTRFIGYPLYLKIFSFDLKFIYLPTVFQIIFFVISIIFLEREIRKKNNKSYFVYLLMAFPGITYANVLMFPDSLVLSLLCLYVYFLLKNNFLFLFLISIVLFFLKSYLIFLIFFTLLIFFEKKFLLVKKFKIKYFFTFIFPIAFYIFLPNHLAQPFFSKIKVENLDFNYQFTCNSKIINLNENDIYLNKHDIQYGSILKKNLELDKSCYSLMEKNVSRYIVNIIFKNHFNEVLNKTILNFVSSFFGISTQDHVTSMIGVDFDNKIKLIENNQINGLDYKIFSKIKDKTFSNKILNTNSLIDKFNLVHIVVLTKLQFFISIIMSVITFFIFIKNKDNIVISNLFALNINFAIMHSVFALVIADRYVFFVLLFQIVIILLYTSRNKSDQAGNYP